MLFLVITHLSGLLPVAIPGIERLATGSLKKYVFAISDNAFHLHSEVVGYIIILAVRPKSTQ